MVLVFGLMLDRRYNCFVLSSSRFSFNLEPEIEKIQLTELSSISERRAMNKRRDVIFFFEMGEGASTTTFGQWFFCCASASNFDFDVSSSVERRQPKEYDRDFFTLLSTNSSTFRRKNHGRFSTFDVVHQVDWIIERGRGLLFIQSYVYVVAL